MSEPKTNVVHWMIYVMRMETNQKLDHILSRTKLWPKAESVPSWTHYVTTVKELPTASGVYAFIQDDIVVYVGKSVNMRRRISHHKHRSTTMRYAYILVKPDDIHWYESVLIARHNPSLNVNHHHLHYPL